MLNDIWVFGPYAEAVHNGCYRFFMPEKIASTTLFITAEALLEHWQGHRRLTRRVIDAFPDGQLFTFSIGAMRPFGALALELIGIAEPMVNGIVTGNGTSR